MPYVWDEAWGAERASNYSNCSLDYDSTTYKILAGLRAGVGLFSALCCLAVIAIVILLKKYKLFSQRLILNIAVAAFVHSLSYTTARVNYYTVRKIQDPYCNFGGLFNDYAATVELISICFVAINIFSVGFCRRNISRVEILCYVVTYGLPSLWLWVPVWLGAYGTSGGWCELRTHNESCERFQEGRYIQFGIWYGPLYLSSIAIIAMLVSVPIKVSCSTGNLKKRHDPVSKAARTLIYNEIRPLIIYPVIYLLLNTFSFISHVYNALHPDQPSMILEFLHVLTSPLRGAFIAVAFAWNRDTWRRLRAGEWRQWCCCRREKEISEEEIKTTTSSEDKCSINISEHAPFLQHKQQQQ